MKNYKILAEEIWNEHIDVFESFDLVCHNTHSLKEETKRTSLFSSLVTLNKMYNVATYNGEQKLILGAIKYLKESKYYSDSNSDSSY